MKFDIEYEQESDGRWIAEIPEIPGALAYGVSPEQAGSRVKALALRVMVERIENETPFPNIDTIIFENRYEPVPVN
jgi:predicted RNase H-like HicB family nuclease